MADKQISDLTAATTPLAGTELVHIIQGGSSRRATVDDVSPPPDAQDVSYDNSTSGLAATNVQAAIDEVGSAVAPDAADVPYTPAISGGLEATNVQDAIDELDQQVAALYARNESLVIAASDETTALTAGTSKIKFRMPYTLVPTEVRASLGTAQTGGSIFTVDINVNGGTILSTKLTIDNGEKTSKTAATPAVIIPNSALLDDNEVTIDVDQIGDGTAAGLKVYLIGYQL